VLAWVHRIARIQVRERDLFGHWVSRWRVIRTSNAYVFRDPHPRPEGVPACKSENRSATQNQEIQSLTAAPADPDSLLERLWAASVRLSAKEAKKRRSRGDEERRRADSRPLIEQTQGSGRAKTLPRHVTAERRLGAVRAPAWCL
jgi:hypothetical protein